LRASVACETSQELRCQAAVFSAFAACCQAVASS
jgi:hypothetical protein